MDTDTTANHAAFNQNQGMWKAYGLLYRLLQNGIPVHWAIKANKTATTDIDVSVTSVRDKRTNTALGAWDYRGGPFIIDSAHAAEALPIISAWWAANGNQPNVHEALAGFSADINVTLRSAPRIAQEAINSGITIAYFNAAGIPDLNGRPWSSTSPNVLTQAQIAAGGLFSQGSVCLQRKFDVFVTPHNSGYSYSLSDPNNLGTRTYAQLDSFVHQGGGWTALCHSILSNENAMANLTLNGTNPVKALFKTSLPGGKPGGFLTTTGFSTIDNTGGTWTVNPAAADLPTAQLVAPAVAPALPGGSVQTWPSPGNPGAPTYWSNTERVGFFDTAGADHDQIISGTYHDGTGLGKLTYIGGHSFSTAVPYSTNAEAPYLRAFYNSLFFNGSAVAKLDLTYSPATYPQGGSSLLTVNIANTGGSVATNVGNVSIALAPGFTYAGTTAGPTPDVSLDGRTLTWIGGLGDIDGGATAVTFQVAVDASVSSTTGLKQFGQFHATYGDVFGEGFTADLCRDITVSPAPAPSLAKTPPTQGPVSTGSTVTWTLSYGNSGAAALLGTTLEDKLPPGFSFISSSSSPSLGAPTVIPAASGTIVRFNVGTIPATTPSAGTVTINARAGPVTAGSGDPPQQTFTNNATLKGQDAAGNPFSVAASADVVVQALDITLGKSVDKSFLNPPGNITYTLTPESSSNDLLDSVRVIDPLPAGVSSPPVSVGQGGTFGPYVPTPAVPGNDPGPPVLDTTMSVSSNFVTQGGTVTVTLNVHSSVAVTNVSPLTLGISGGTATCTGPTPASADIPAGGAGVNFAWTCTLSDLGEYTFSQNASDATQTTIWPSASSSSVLSAAGGGPNVVTWNLGSNSAGVGGSVITSGYTAGVYGLRGAGQRTFQKYDLTTGSWSAKANTLANVAKGGALAADGAGTIYELAGNGTQGFSAYAIAGDTWTAKANTGTNVGEGGALVYLNSGTTKYVYALIGGGTKTFKRYDVAANTWTQMADTPAGVKKGGSLATDGTNIYALQGGGQKGFWRYNVASNTWTVLATVPDNINWGGALTRVGNFLYATIGGGKNKFYRYDIAANAWTAMATTPANVADGGALTTDGTFIYAFRGKSNAFWRYDIPNNRWTVLAPFTANTDQGGALAFDPGLNPHGRFSEMSASRSLTVTGDTVDVTFTLTSTEAVSNVAPGALTVTPTGGASCSTLTGPVLTSADDDISGAGDAVVYQWTCTVAAGTNPGSLSFSDTASAGGGVTFATATSNSVIVSPPLTYTVTVPVGAPNPVVNAGLMAASGQTTSSPQVSTFTGSPNLTIVKSNSPAEGTTLSPGDAITYSMTVENNGTGVATGVAVSDPVPANTGFASCEGGSSCSESSGTVTWTLGTLAPGETATVSFTVNTSTSLAISDTPYTISNSASVDSDQTNPVTSKTVTNQLAVQPEIVKTVSAPEAGPGDTLTYTLTVSNPGASFTGDVSDDVPAGTTFSAGSCSPACAFAAGTVTWSSQSVPHGTSTFSFDVTVNAGTGGTTVTNSGTLDPSSPDLGPIESNPTETEIGPVLGIVKTGDPTGTVQSGDQITYTLVVSNESGVTAHDVVASDPVPTGTSFGTCTTPVGTCGQSGGDVTFDLGDLAGGATVSVSFTVTVGTPPVGTLQITNQAQVSAGNSPDPVPSNPVTNPLPFPAILLSKSANRTTYDSVGDVISYEYLVTNNSTTATLAGPVTVSDDKVGVTCPSGDLAPLASVTCHASHTVTQADLNAGSVTNTATAHAAGLDSNEDQVTVDAIQTPALTLVKHAAETSFDSASDVLHYTFAVQNSGSVSLAGPVTVTDDKASDESCPAVTTVGNQDGLLDPGETITCTATYSVTQADLDGGSVTNTATAHAGGTDSNQDSVTVVASPKPHVTLVKEATLDTTQAGEPDRVDAGDVVNYTLTATNDGNLTLTGVAISDPALPALDCAPLQPATLAPGATLVCTGTHTLTQADVDLGHIDNLAGVSGTDPNGKTVSESDNATVPLPPKPHLTLIKEATLDKTQAGQPDRVDPGDVVNYTLTATNDGNVTLTTVLENDPTLTLDCTPPQPVTLAPGDVLVCTGTRTLTQADINLGRADNAATVTGTDPNGKTVGDSDNATVPLGQERNLNLVKDVAENSYNAVDDVLHYTYTVQNTGNVSLAGPVTITDDKAADESCPAVTTVGNNDANLDPGETIVCTATYTVTQADLNAGRVTNTATADADGTTSNQDQAIVSAVQGPALTLVKDAAENSFNVAGAVLHYTFTVENTGNVSLAGPVTVTDDKATDESCPALTTVGNNDSNLDPGETIVCTATYTVTQADLDHGSVTNSATAQAGGTTSNQDQVVVSASQEPHLTLVKDATLDMTQAGEPDRVDPGDVINYTLTATNDGNETLTTVVENDPTLALDCAPTQPATLAPGDVLVCTGTRVLTQADIDAGHADNLAAVSGVDPNGKTVSDTDNSSVPLGQESHLTLVKNATLDMTQAGQPDRVDPGDVVNYTLTATNDGNVTLTTVIENDPTLTLDCTPSQPATLAPGDVLVCTGTRVLTQADIDSGHADNLADVSGVDPNGNTVGDTDNSSVPLGQEPHVTLVKDATLDMTQAGPPDRADAGDVVNYTLTATNDGNVTLTTVVENDPTLALDCTPSQPATLAPGDVLVCTGTRVLTQADIDSGQADNLADVSGVDPNGKTVSDTGSASVPLAGTPSLTLVKQAIESSYSAVDTVLHYTYAVENTGNVSLAGRVSVSDDKATDESCPDLTTVGNNDSSFDPGETVTCTASYTVTQDDLNAGSVTNTASAHAGGTESNEDSATVDAVQAPALTLAKQATEAGYDAVGDVLHYTYTVQNTGNVSLAGPVTVSDDKAADESCPDLTTVGNKDSSFDPGETVTCTATYTVTQDDLDAGFVTNKASAQAGGTTSNEDDATVTAGQQPQIEITKSSDATAATTVGDTVTFTFLVANVGNVTITSYTLSDPLPGISGIDCTGQPSQLAPGDSATCTATYTVTPADMNAGLISNTATADGQTTNAGPVTDSDGITVPLTGFGTLQVVKRLVPSTDGGRFDLNIDGGVPDATGVGDGGSTDPVPVSPKTGHSVSETAAEGTDLTDYDSATACTRDGDSIPNLDPSNITVGLGEAVVCTITNTRKAAELAVTKSAPAVAHDGDTIIYGIKVTNTGAVALRNVSLIDRIGTTPSPCEGGPVFTGGDTNGDGRLDTTETWTYTCTYRVLHGDEDATHHIVNVVSVTATNGSGFSVGPVEASATTLITHPAIALLKTGPATATAGDLIAYELAVTNAGDTSFDEPMVGVADPQCIRSSVRLIGKAGDTSPATLDPGERWIFGCSVQTAGSDVAVHNSATAEATDQHGTTVTAGDSADTALTPSAPRRGRAKLTGRTGCVYKPFMATVRGVRIAKVTFVLNGRVIKRETSRRTSAVMRVRIDPARLRAGTSRLVARVTFTTGTTPRSKTLRLSFKLCPKQVVSPQFTG